MMGSMDPCPHTTSTPSYPTRLLVVAAVGLTLAFVTPALIAVAAAVDLGRAISASRRPLTGQLPFDLQDTQ